MTHMQAAGHVRRRDHDAVAFFAGIAVWFEITLFLPMFIQRLLNFLRAVCFIEGRLSFVDMRRCIFHFLFISISWRRCRGQVEADAAIRFISVARQLFQIFFIRHEVYHFMESGGKTCEFWQQADKQVAR